MNKIKTKRLYILISCIFMLCPVLTFADSGNVDEELAFLEELVATTDGERCNGGTWNSDGVVLDCPTSGGPICKYRESCKCLNGANVCTKKETEARSLQNLR